MRIAFVNYNILPEYSSPDKWIKRISPSVGIMEALTKYAEVHYFIRIRYSKQIVKNRVFYYFEKRGMADALIPYSFNRSVKKVNPDVVLVFGLHFPLQVIQLFSLLGSKVKIIAEHHADLPGNILMKQLQKWADNYIERYHFTVVENANEWLSKKIIKDVKKCFEIRMGSTFFKRQNKSEAKHKIGFIHSVNFLFVGRLNVNKDPLTVIDAFMQLTKNYTDIALHMIYQTDELLDQIQQVLIAEPKLLKNVFLHGKKNYEELEIWYNASDCYISASHSESGSFALLEAMACGCIPIVSNIPSSMDAIGGGELGFYFEPGNSQMLYNKMIDVMNIDRVFFSDRVASHFDENYSFEKIAKDFYSSAISILKS